MLGLALLVLGYVLPNHYPPWATFHSDALAFAALTAWLLAVTIGAPVPVPSSSAPLAVLGLLVVPVLQHFGGLLSFRGDVLLAVFYLGGLAGSLFIGLRLAASADLAGRAMTGMAFSLLLAGVLSAVLSLFQWLRMEEALGVFISNVGATQRPFANFGQPNLFGTLVVMAVASVAFLYDRRSLGTAAATAVVFVLSIGLALAQSRAAFLDAIAIFAWYLLMRRRIVSRMSLRAALGWAAWFAACATALPLASVALELAGARDVTFFSNNGRLHMWAQVAQGILDSPWAGYGWGQTAAAQMAGALAHRGELATVYAHNVLLDLVAWFGIPIGVIVIVAGGWWSFKRLQNAADPVALYALAICIPVVVHSQFEFPFAYAYFLFPVAVLAGLARGLEAGTPFSSARSDRWLLAPAAVIVALAVWTAVEYLEIEEDFRVVRFEVMRVGKTPASHVQPRPFLLDQLGIMLKVARIQPAPGMSAAEIEEARAIALRFPWAPLGLRYAMVLEANGRSGEARRQMEVVRGNYGEVYYRAALQRMEALHAELASQPAGPVK